jgi:uncharacterized protein YcbX
MALKAPSLTMVTKTDYSPVAESFSLDTVNASTTCSVISAAVSITAVLTFDAMFAVTAPDDRTVSSRRVG